MLISVFLGVLVAFRCIVLALVLDSSPKDIQRALWGKDGLRELMERSLGEPCNLPIWEVLLHDGAFELQTQYDSFCEEWTDEIFTAISGYVERNRASAWTLLSASCIANLSEFYLLKPTISTLPTYPNPGFGEEKDILGTLERELTDPGRVWPLRNFLIPLAWGRFSDSQRDLLVKAPLRRLLAPDAVVELVGNAGLGLTLDSYIEANQEDSPTILMTMENLLGAVHLMRTISAFKDANNSRDTLHQLVGDVIGSISRSENIGPLERSLANWIGDTFLKADPLPHTAMPDIMVNGAFYPGTEGLAALSMMYGEFFPDSPREDSHFQALVKAVESLPDERWLSIMGLAGASGSGETCARLGGPHFFTRLLTISANGIYLKHPVWACLDTAQSTQMLTERYQPYSSMNRPFPLALSTRTALVHHLSAHPWTISEMLPPSLGVVQAETALLKTLDWLLRQSFLFTISADYVVSPYSTDPMWSLLLPSDRAIIVIVAMLQLNFPRLGYKLDPSYGKRLACEGGRNWVFEILSILYGIALCNVDRSYTSV